MTEPNCQCWVKDRRKNNRREQDMSRIQYTYRPQSDGEAKIYGTQTGWWTKDWKNRWETKDLFCPRCGIEAITKETK